MNYKKLQYLKNVIFSNWKRECREFGEDGGEMKMTCSGSSRDIRQDCPIWTHWSLNVNTCGWNSGNGVGQKPG